MTNTNNARCLSCGKKAHNFEKEEAFSCIPPKEVLKFGQYEINKEYREALYLEFPFYNAEEVVGSYLGHNHNFKSQRDWFEGRNKDFDEDDTEE